MHSDSISWKKSCLLRRDPRRYLRNVTHPRAVKIETAVARTAGAAERSVPELVVLLPLLRVRQDRIGLRCLLELLRSLFARVDIRVILFCELSVCFFQVVISGVLLYTEYLVVISFLCHLENPFQICFRSADMKKPAPTPQKAGAVVIYLFIPRCNPHRLHRHLRRRLSYSSGRPAVPPEVLPAAASAHTSL